MACAQHPSTGFTSGAYGGKKKVSIDFEHSPSNNLVKIKKASKFNLKDIDVQIRLGTFTIIT